MVVNHAALDDLVHVLEQRAGPPSPASLAGLLAVPGIVSPGARTDAGPVADELTADLEAVLDLLVASRLGEGASLAGIIGGLLDEVDDLVALAHDEARGEPERLRRVLDERVRDLVDDPAIDDARLAQEVAFLVSRADVREEIDRLDRPCGGGAQPARRGESRAPTGFLLSGTVARGQHAFIQVPVRAFDQRRRQPQGGH